MAKRKGKGGGERARAAQERAEPKPGTTVPHLAGWVPGAVFVGLTVLLFRDFLFSDRMLFGNDTLGLGYVARAFYADALAEGTFPRWAPLLLGGTPFLEALSGGDSLYPPSLFLLLLMEPYRALGWKLVIHFAAAGFFMFGWARSLGASRPGALLGGTAYMLAPYFVSLVHPGHDGKIFVTALAPLLFWAAERHFQRPTYGSVAGIALVVGLVISTTHFQMAYFLFGAVGLYALFRSFVVWRSAREGRPGNPAAGPLRFALFLSASLAGAGLAAGQLVPAVDYVTEYSRRVQTTREAAGESGVAWSSSWSIHPEEAMALVIPEFAGNNAGGAAWAEGSYWGRNVLKDNHESAGLVVLLLAAVAVAAGPRRRLAWFFSGLAGLVLLFALGAHTPVWRIFYEVVPGIRLFRAPSQAMFLFALSASTLAALGLDRVLTLSAADAADRRRVFRTLWGASALLGAVAVLAATGALTSLWTSVVYTDADPARLDRLAALEPFIVRGASISFLVTIATAAVVWGCAEARLAPAAAAAALVVLVAADELRVSSTFVQVIDFEQWAAPDPNMEEVLRREGGAGEPFRLLSFRQNAQDVRPALYGIELAGGHHPNDLSRYRELVGMVGSGLPEHLLDDDIRRLLNVRYILWPDYQFGQSIGGMPLVSRTTLPDGRPFETVLEDSGLPRARLVGQVVVRSDEEAVPYMLSDAFDPEREVVLPEPAPIELTGEPPQGSVEWLERSANQLRLAVVTDRPAMLVVADNWFPAWRATVDGEEAPLLRAYHTLRAVPVTAGSHEVVMQYRSDVVRTSLWVSLAFLLGLTALVGLHLGREWRARSRP